MHNDYKGREEACGLPAGKERNFGWLSIVSSSCSKELFYVLRMLTYTRKATGGFTDFPLEGPQGLSDSDTLEI